jgi:geranylgeranyl pyrophosphate synthase
MLSDVFDLDAYLLDARVRVERYMDAVLPPADERPQALHQAMRYSVLSGGKRLRPALCLAAAAAFDPDAPAMPPAAALELFHCYTLIHDDLPCMDDDALRRGNPSCHIVFGEATAVLAGDALQTFAFELLSDMPGRTPAISGRLVLELARAAGSRGVAGGQMEDLTVNPSTVDAAAVEFIHLHKTADLFRAAVRIGAITGGAPDAAMEPLSRYAEALGLAFQASDDVLDWRAAGGAGKRRELSCVTLYGLDGARQRVERFTVSAHDALRDVRGDTQVLAALATHMAQRQS